MQTLKTLWNTIKRVLWFAWRHALTLCNAWITISILIEFHAINWKTEFYFVLIAALLDWIKMKIKIQSSTSFHHSSDAPQPLHVQNYWNNSVVGSTSYLSSIGSSSHYH